MRKSNSRNFRRGRLAPRRRTQRRVVSKSFDPSHLVKKATAPAPIEVIKIDHEFNDFSISDQLKASIAHKGYETPTPIQDQAIPHILKGKDVVGLANTGTGKTAAFLIPLIENIIKDDSYRILIITPTRELASQIQMEMQGFAHGMGIYSTLCIGGVSIVRQIERLKRNPHFIIGTPGRIKDLTERGKIKLETMKAIVLDEVDQMLDMGFIRDIKHLIGLLPKVRHSLFFSATMPDNVKEIMHSFLTDPITISVRTGHTVDNIDQDVVKVAGRQKIEILKEMLNDPDFSKVLVFGRTKWKLNKLEKKLRDDGYRVSAIHGNKTQQQRQRVLNQFKKNRLQALLATDVVSRGIDIDDVTHVINYDMPQSYEEYIHRIGRTGRADKKGKAITFIN
ncbi:DEAD/DEAH box helicase [Patescibacteria group bacterium]